MKKLDKFNCIVTVIDGRLCICKIAHDGGPEFCAGALNWQEVRAPVAQDFLDAANLVLGTKFTVEDFVKRKKS